MRRARRLAQVVALAAVVAVGAGACAFAPSHKGESGGSPVSPGAAGVTGASAPPVPAAQVEPAAEPPVTPKPVEADPVQPDPVRPEATGPKPPSHGCPVGESQRAVETALAALGGFGPVTVDGRQSAADCKAIKKFQRRYGISPAEGRAGPTTAGVAKRLAATKTDRCDAGEGLTFCIDLTRQTVWAMRDGEVVMAPTVTRTGMAGGYQTPAGRYEVNWRNVKEWSNPYEVWLPYWQHFVGGMGFHETTTYIHDGSIGSHGCVNLLPADARLLWELGEVGTAVHVFGRRPGT
jgi:peptidoglycan hydrolase-like protein with peptidoglycan-binding domain